jgi:DNA-binding response OmpR family regulator
MKRKALIIDDEFELCMLLKLYLIEKDYEVAMAFNLKDGINKIECFHPSIVFLDNNLPDGSGWQMTQEILEHYPSIKISLISALRPSVPSSISYENIFIMEKPLSKKEIDKCLYRLSA